MSNISKKDKRKPTRINSLYKRHNTKVRHELLDADYLKKLDEKTLTWYAQFTDEYIGGSISKNPDGTVEDGHIHNTPELAKKCYDANNWRNSDLYSVTKANNLMTSMDLTFEGPDFTTRNRGNGAPADVRNEYTHITNVSLTEQATIAEIDAKETEESLSFKEYIMVRANMKSAIRDHYDQYFITKYPNAYIYYTIYDNRKLTEKQLERLLNKPKLLDKLFKKPEFMQRKKNGTEST